MGTWKFEEAPFANGSGANTIVITPSAPLAAQKLLVAQIIIAPQRTITPPGGWTRIRVIDSGPNFRSVSFYRITSGAEPASYTFSWTGSFLGASGAIAVYSGVYPAVLEIENGVDIPATDTFDTPSVVATRGNSLVVTQFGIDAFGGNTWTTPAGMNERYDIDNGDNSHCGDDVVQAAAGATGVKESVSTFSAPGTAQIMVFRETEFDNISVESRLNLMPQPSRMVGY